MKFKHLMIMISLCVFSFDTTAEENVYQQQTEHFIWQLRPQLEPLSINQLHSWVLTVTSIDREIVNNATLSIDGGMPEHDHGLPTTPQFTQYLGDGQYLLQGMKFHMPGVWELKITLNRDASEETAIFTIEL